MKSGLLGRKLGHSYSPQIHAYFGSYPYPLFEKEPEEVETFLRSGDFTGINVTIPYKKTVIPYCTELTEVARRMGAVNTVIRREDGSLLGHNTDYYGFTSMVERSGLQPKGKKAIVLGTGGASNTAVIALRDLGAEVVVISHQENTPENLARHPDTRILVNATPVGMFPQNGETPVALSLFPQLEGVLDMIYNPSRTKLLLEAQARGLITENGLWMLVAQAKEAAQWFTGKSFDDSIMEAIHRALTLQMENIVLIGMPGSGKSHVGRILAQKLNREFADADALVEQLSGRPIPEIFAQAGEEAFRALETQALSLLGKRSGLVIATGGGCVTREENYPLLRQNSTVVWLQRDIRVLPTQGRPLSQQNSLDRLYCRRKPLYEVFSDHTVQNSGTPEAAADAITALLGMEE